MANSSTWEKALPPLRLLMRLAIPAAPDQLVALPAGPNWKPILDRLKQDVSHRGGGLTIRPAGLLKAQLDECFVQFDPRSVSGRLLAEPSSQHGVLDVR